MTGGGSMTRKAADFFSDENGATAIEYAAIAGLLSIAIVTSVEALGTSVDGLFTQVANAFN